MDWSCNSCFHFYKNDSDCYCNFLNTKTDENELCCYYSHKIKNLRPKKNKMKTEIDEKTKALKILKANLECDQRQYEDCCYLGDNRCMKCPVNIEQGAVSEHIVALKMAIKALEGETI